MLREHLPSCLRALILSKAYKASMAMHKHTKSYLSMYEYKII